MQILQRRSVSKNATRQIQINADKRYSSHHQTSENNVGPHSNVNHAITHLTRRTTHHVICLTIHTHSQSRSSVGQQVNPQQLCSQQRHGHARRMWVVNAQNSCKHNAKEDRKHFAHVRTEQVAQEFANIVENHTTFAHSSHNGREIVIRQNHLGRLLGHFRTRNAHSHTNIRGLHSWSIVHTVTGHSHNIALRLQRLNDAQLVFWCHASIHRYFCYSLLELIIAHSVELVAGQSAACRASRSSRRHTRSHTRTNTSLRSSIFPNNAQISSNASCGQRMIARNHNRANACTVSLSNRITHFGTRRINNTHHTRPNVVALNHVILLRNIGHTAACIGADALNICQAVHLQRAIRLTKRTVRLIRQAFYLGQNVSAIIVRKRTHSSIHLNKGAARKQHIRSTLGICGHRVIVALIVTNNRLHFALRSEWNFCHALHALIIMQSAHLASSYKHRRFGRISHNLPVLLASLRLMEFSIIRQSTSSQRELNLTTQWRLSGQLSAINVEKLTRWIVSSSSNFHFTAWSNDCFHSHFVAG